MKHCSPISRIACSSLLCVTLSYSAASAAQAEEFHLLARMLWRYDEAVDGCEIACYEPDTEMVYVTISDGVSVLEARTGRQLGGIDAPPGFHATSIAFSNGHLAIAWAAKQRTGRGKLGVFSVAPGETCAPKLLRTFAAGYLPDMVTFSPDGRWLLVANEGEPSDDYAMDPEGSITAIDLAQGVANARIHQLTFWQFNPEREVLREQGVRIFGPSLVHDDKQATVSEDLEPEFIAVSADSRRAWVSLQENNAVAEIDLDSPKISTLHTLGLQPFGANSDSLDEVDRGFDASDADSGTQILNWPVSGLRQPDSIGLLHAEGVDYLLTVNEGDPRKYGAFQECCAVGNLWSRGVLLDHQLMDEMVLEDSQLGHLEVSVASGDRDGDGQLDAFHCFGGRSFSVFRADRSGPLDLVFDSGNDFEWITSQEDPERYNADSTPHSQPDVRSPNRGPEPEGLAIGKVGSRQIAAIGLERSGGVMLYDVSSPLAPEFVMHLPPFRTADEMDCAPEGLLLISDKESPLGKALLIVCYEKSHSVTAYELTQAIE